MSKLSSVARLSGAAISQRSGLLLPIFLVLATTPLSSPPSHAQGEMRSGKAVVETVCTKCHATGEQGAPRIGDSQAWIKRASQGLSSLTRHALEGIRDMPAHGGQPDLGDLEIARAITHMVNLSGGQWVEPAGIEELVAERSGEQVVNAQCVKCHEEGLTGAPRIGDRQAWVPRLSKGLVVLVRSAIHGHGGMPPRGGLASLTDNEIREAILFMFDPASASLPIVRTEKSIGNGGMRASAMPQVTPHRLVADGIEMYVGFMPASALTRFPDGAAERTMHGGIPKGGNYYHANVTLYDQQQRTLIGDAVVHLKLGRSGAMGSGIELEKMFDIGKGSYGNYFRISPGKRHLVSLHVTRPESGKAVDVQFEETF